jgi:hypothetical protein
MRILFISAFANINSKSNNRLLSIFENADGEKLVITTDFNHRMKKYYTEVESGNPDQIHLHVPSYKNNLSIKRIWSHIIFAKRLMKYLKTMKVKPDVAYCTMPTSSSAYVCAKYCKKYGVKFVIDVIDLWPDSLLPLVKGRAVIKRILYPWTYLTRYAYRHADVIMGESVAYLKEAKKYNQGAMAYPIYLGVDMQLIDRVKMNNPVSLNKPKDEIWIAYAGSLGTSYDFDTLLDAVKNINGRCKYKLWFIGDGVRHNEIATVIKEANLNAEITGFLSYDQLLGYLAYCDIAINIFRKGTKVVYSYKFNDYIAMNCFVLNSLEGETSSLVDDYKVGLNFDFSKNQLSIVLTDVIDNWDFFSKWKLNTDKLVSEKLDKVKIYSVVSEIF